MTDEELETTDEGDTVDEDVGEKAMEPCDPITMTCDEIQEEVTKKLIPESVRLERAVTEIDHIRQNNPSEELDRAYDSFAKKKKDTDDKIFNLFQNYTICKTKPDEEPPEQE